MKGKIMKLKEIPTPVSRTACVPCLSEQARWQGMWPSRVATMCGVHYREWQEETL